MTKWFRIVGWLEALSFLVLLGIAMPMKYVWAMPEATRVPGMAHGLLFIAYVAMAGIVSGQQGWPKRRLWLAYVASVLPFGTIVFDRKFLHGGAAPAPQV